MRSLRVLAFLLVLAPLSAGCFAAEGAGTANFSLTPQKVGWYAGDEARFVLAIESSFFRSDPAFTVDRHFAIEEIRFEEDGVSFGGDFETRNPDDVRLRLVRDNVTGTEFVLNGTAPSLDMFVTLPEDLRDSRYTMSLKLFEVGWVESSVFRVDRR